MFRTFVPGTEVVCLTPQKGEILGGVVKEQLSDGRVTVIAHLICLFKTNTRLDMRP